jgi:hypothetical protein
MIALMLLCKAGRMKPISDGEAIASLVVHPIREEAGTKRLH